jgi:uroporphyrinogen decarboxylase
VLTHREHLATILRGQPSAWIPNYELGCWGQTVERWLKEGWPEDRSYLGRDDMFEGEPHLKLDRRAFLRLNTWLSPGFEYQVLEETDRYLVARHGNGVVTKALKEGTVRGTRMSMDTYLDFPVKDRATWADMKRRYNARALWRYPFWFDEMVRTWRQRDYPVVLLGNGAFGLYSQLRSWVGTEGISTMFYDDPALVEDMLEFATEFFLELVEPALRSGVQFGYFNFFEDCAGKAACLYGPNLYERFFRKHYDRIIRRLNEAGIRSIWLDSDGTPTPLIPCWMDSGVNMLWPLEQAAGMDPRAIRKQFGRGLCLAGGLDKREIAKGPVAIRAELEAKIPPLLEQGGYIPHIDHAIDPDISYDNMMVYMETKLRLMGR